MGFSVVGLPHYTIWHLYEPSADDLKHMERMEEERLEKEAVEQAEKERAERVGQGWQDKKEEWERDKKEIKEKALERERNLVGGEKGPHAHAGEVEAVGRREKEENKVRALVR
jgi:mannan polymerase II complex ANP1 subunit